MTHAEREALRAKHYYVADADETYCMYCSEWKEGTDDIWPVVYPCDVIKVLDAYEEFIVPLKEKP